MLGIRPRIILTNTVLIVVLIGAFSLGISMESRRLIDESAERVQRRTKESIQRSGDSTLAAIIESTRIALAQNDFATIQETVRNLARRDRRVIAMAVLDRQNILIAHSDPKRVGQKSTETQALFGSGAAPRAMLFRSHVSYQNVKLATAQLAFSLAQLEADNRRTRRLKKESIRSTLIKTVTVGLLAILAGIALSVIQALRIVQPIAEVAHKADQIASGDLEARVAIRSNDELGLLADRFNYMAEQVTILLTHARQKAALEQELALASAVQSTLLPSSSGLERDGLSVSGHFQPATRCAGDWWGLYDLSGSRTLLLIGDVTGHGVAAAMITAAAKGAVSSTVAASHGSTTLSMVLNAMNVAIHEASRGQFVMTCFAAIYDPNTRRLHYANAGHNFPIYLDHTQGSIESLVARGNRLGDLIESIYDVRSRDVLAGDGLVLYTDGLTESPGAKGREFGVRRLREVVAAHHDQGPEALRDAIVTSAARFSRGVARHDDVTLIVVRFS